MGAQVSVVAAAALGRLRRALGRWLTPWTVRRWAAEDAEGWRVTGGVVRGGPFRGMAYVRRAGGSALAPKLVGTYELELAGVLEQVLARGITRWIDIGAAEGYYAVGVLMRAPTARMIAFESDEPSRVLLADLAGRNAVAERLTIRTACAAQALHGALQGCGAAAVICDVEGAEVELLDPAAVPALGGAEVLVEVHEGLRPGVGRLLRERFEPTHEVVAIAGRPRTAGDLPRALRVGWRWRRRLMDERRKGPIAWLWLRPRAGA